MPFQPGHAPLPGAGRPKGSRNKRKGHETEVGEGAPRDLAHTGPSTLAELDTGKCRFCDHPQRAAIEGEWLTGANFPALAKRYGVTAGVLWRHWRRGHPAKTLGDAWKNDDEARTLMQWVRQLLKDVEEMFEEVRTHPGCVKCGAGDTKGALEVVDRLTRLLDLLGKATGEIGQGNTTLNVLIAPEQAARMVGAANDLELADELEKRARLLRERWAQDHPEALLTGVIEEAVLVPELVGGFLGDPEPFLDE